MNRHLTDLGSAYLNSKEQKELSHRYVLGLYYILEKLTQRFKMFYLKVVLVVAVDMMQECSIICHKHGLAIIQMLFVV